MELRGKYSHITNDDAASGDFILPTGFTPAKNRVSAIQQVDGAERMIPLYIYTNGWVRADFPDWAVDGGTPVVFELNCEFEL